jgi:spore coat polysaccharide biosynthesis protein SpsF
VTDRSRFKTEQEAFWAGSFGTDYISRNQGDSAIASNLALFAQALRRAEKPATCIEFGANIGLNLDALRLLYPDQDQYAVEINPSAAANLRTKLPEGHVFETSILDFQTAEATTYGLVVIKGVLIHINPEYLDRVYAKLYESTGRYLLMCEYYNPTPVAVSYRGHSERLFKRDFAGEIMERYQSLELLDYGFVYHRDHSFPHDDITWFLMERK